MVIVSAWPTCSSPVTLGGGMTMTNGFRFGSTTGVKYPCSSQNSYHFFSICPGS